MSDDRRFSQIGDAAYQLADESLGAQLTVDRLRRDHHELLGELAVATTLAGARTVDVGDGRRFLSVCTLNLSSAVARTQRAKMLSDRSEAPDIDWFALLEELCVKTIAAERQGSPAKLLHTFRRADPDEALTYDVHGWPWLKHHVMLTFADGGALKSYLALYGAALLSQRGVQIGYGDWELIPEDHLERLASLFPVPLPRVHYLRLEKPLIEEADRLMRETHRLDLDYWILDSVGFGTAGPPESAEHALAYMRVVRQLGVGVHLLAHINKSEAADQKPFGSTYWHNCVRSSWFAKASKPQDGRDLVQVALHNRKSNLTKIHPAIGFQFDFTEAGVTTVTRIDPADIDELARDLPTWQRVLNYLKSGGGRPQTIAEIAEALDLKPDSVHKAVSPNRKGGSIFTKVPGSDGKPRIALVDRRPA